MTGPELFKLFVDHSGGEGERFHLVTWEKVAAHLTKEIAELNELLGDPRPEALAKKAKLAGLPLRIVVKPIDQPGVRARWLASCDRLNMTIGGETVEEVTRHAQRQIAAWHGVTIAELDLTVVVEK